MILLVQVPTCVKQIFCYIRLANIFLNYLQDKISLPGQSNRFPMRKHIMSKHKNFLGENQNNLTVTSVHPSQVAHNSSFTKYFQHRVSRLKSAAEPCELPGNHQNNLFSFSTETSQCRFPPFQLKSTQRFWTSLQAHPHTALLLSQQTLPKGYRGAQGRSPLAEIRRFSPRLLPASPPGWFSEVSECVFRSPKAHAVEAQRQGTETMEQLH